MSQQNIKQIIMWNWIYNVGSAISSTVSAAATYFGGKKAGSSIQDGIQNGCRLSHGIAR